MRSSAKGTFLFQCFPSLLWGLKVFCFLSPTPEVGLEGPSSSCGSPDDAVENALRLDLVSTEDQGTGIPVAPYLRQVLAQFCVALVT